MVCLQSKSKLGLLPPAAVQWLFLAILLITLCSHAKPCTCSSSSSSNHGRSRTATYTWNTSFQEMDQGLLFRRDAVSSSVTLLPGSLGYYYMMKEKEKEKENSSQTGFKLTDPGWFVIPKWIDPRRTTTTTGHGTGSGGSQHHDEVSSFSIVFTLNAVDTPLVFDILPRLQPSDDYSGRVRPRDFEPVKIESFDSTAFHSGRTIRVTTQLQLPEQQNDDDDPNPAAATYRYSVRINYDRATRNLSVDLVPDGADAAGGLRPGTGTGTTAAAAAEPAAASRQLDEEDNLTPDALLFAISSSMKQLLQLHAWNFTIEVPVTEQPRVPNTVTIVSSVLGSAAATAAVAVAVYLYLNSKYRRWRKELDQLAKTMQSLPGVPMQVDFADIKKATGDFHEAMRLGQGGFGAVYRCKLPAGAPRKKTGGDHLMEMMEVAVKKFTRADTRGYEDFLAEVSIINRLRHKNIVPLVGWSYNRGEHILIYEYMPNGSLDQHLFRRSGGDEQQQPTGVIPWRTRYDIVRDIATGLQYVHHEYEPMVLHRDIKASNIMMDSAFRGRLGDFGLACVLADGESSYSDRGAPGTIGFRAPEYVYSGKATRKTDVFAFGVLVLETVTGKRAIGRDVEFGHITDWVWKLHLEGNLLAAVDDAVLSAGEFDAGEAVRLLQLGMACSSPNPGARPTMADAVQVIGKSVPPPDMPLSKPPLVWPPPEGWEEEEEEEEESTTTYGYGSTSTSNFDTTSTFMVETTTTRTGRKGMSSSTTSYPSEGRKIFSGGRLRLSL